MLLYEIADEFSKAKLPFVVVGGFALAIHGIVRGTVDVDLVIRLEEADLKKAEAILSGLGLSSRIPVRAGDIAKFRIEYIEKRNLRAWSFVDWKNPMRQVDILIDRDISEIDREVRSVRGRKIPVASLEALAVMKKEAGRPIDLQDLEAIREKIKAKKDK